MIEGIIIKKLKRNEDKRGWLAEIFRNDETNFRPAMAYISVTKPGVSRGPHEHQAQSDCFIFLGPGTFELYFWDARAKSKTKGVHEKIQCGQDNPAMIIVPPGVVHGYKNISGKDAWCINLPDKLYRGEGKKEELDEVRWEEKADSPYKII
jgi:dTDP-4-dehydrorhamnose 3,5-epimerase